MMTYIVIGNNKFVLCGRANEEALSHDHHTRLMLYVPKRTNQFPITIAPRARRWAGFLRWELNQWNQSLYLQARTAMSTRLKPSPNHPTCRRYARNRSAQYETKFLISAL